MSTKHTSYPMIIRNSIVTPDGTELVSEHVHDYKTHKDAVTGEVYMVDGGKEYMRRNVNKVPAQDTSVVLDEKMSIEELTTELKWGTRGKNGDEPLRYIPIREMETDHIWACLCDVKAGRMRMHPVYHAAMILEMYMRDDKSKTLAHNPKAGFFV